MKAVDRVRQALSAADHEDSIAEFPAGTHSAADAAAAVGCAIAQIAKSIVFRAGDEVVLVIASGTNRIDRAKVSAVLGRAVKPADAAWVEANTGFTVGGVSPVGHRVSTTIVIDQTLLPYEILWAAAGSPTHAFQTTPGRLVTITGGIVADIRQD